MYCDINNKEERNSAMIIKIISEHKQANKTNKELKESWDNAKKSTFTAKYEYSL